MNPKADPVSLSGLVSLVEDATGATLEPGFIDAASQPYFDLLGFLPPRVGDRLHVSSILDRGSVDLQEALRNHAMDTKAFDPKTVQLIVFAILMMDLSDAATTHAIAARRCGATWEELQAIISLVFLFRGLPAANRGASVLIEVMRKEKAVAAG